MIEGLDFELTIAERAFQRGPDQGFCQRIECVEHQIATLRPVESPSANAHEVAAPHAAVLERRLDSPEEIFVRWGRLKDDWRPMRVCIVHNDVDLIFVEGILFVHRW